MGTAASIPGNRGAKLHRALREAWALVVVALAVTAVSWAVRPDRLPLSADPTFYELELEAPLVSPEKALQAYNEGTVLFVDTRPVDLGSVPTIPGAVPIRQDSFDDDLLDLFDFLTPEDPLILFGDGQLSLASAIAARLEERGYTHLKILAGGLAAWSKAGGPLTTPQFGEIEP